MKTQELSRLKPGDIIRNNITGETAMIVNKLENGSIIAIRSYHIYEPEIWKVVMTAEYKSHV